MRTYSHIRRKALDEAAAALEPSFKLRFPRHKRGLKLPLCESDVKEPTPHGTCDRLMSQFTSQWDDLKRETGCRRTAPGRRAKLVNDWSTWRTHGDDLRLRGQDTIR